MSALDDKLAVTIASACDKTSRILAVASPSPDLMRANERAYATLELLLAEHAEKGIYLGADECGHTEPGKLRHGISHDRWLEDHPVGTNPDSRDSPRICLMTETGRHCPACTLLAYGEEATGDDYVTAGSCLVRPVIARELLGEDGNG